MKIFYGIQGTGNGHITRGRIMARELQAANLEVTYQFTGRPQDKFFDMEIFRGYQWRQGLTFSTRNGKIDRLDTIFQSNPLGLLKDIRQLDLRSYDVVICDYEPITAWAARRQQKKTIGISHQYAFQYQIPRAGTDPISEAVMRNFAPVDIGIGLHWHHFDQPILPPVIETPIKPKQIQKDKIVVYLPFEDQQHVMKLLSPFKAFEFFIFSPDDVTSCYPNIHCRPLSLLGFQQNLSNCAGIICNAGFELASEALQLGKKILVKPVHAQMEQTSNAAALQILGYGKMMHTLDNQMIEQWLYGSNAIQIIYPNTAKYLVQWIADGMPPVDSSWYRQIWEDVKVITIDD